MQPAKPATRAMEIDVDRSRLLVFSRSFGSTSDMRLFFLLLLYSLRELSVTFLFDVKTTERWGFPVPTRIHAFSHTLKAIPGLSRVCGGFADTYGSLGNICLKKRNNFRLLVVHI